MSKQGSAAHQDVSTDIKADEMTLDGHHTNDIDEKTAPSEEKNVDPEEKNPELDYPDGGWKAWSVAFGAACFTFSTFGFINSYGVFQAYYQTTLLPTASPSAISWIGSIQYALVFLPALPMGRLLDLGYMNLPMSVFGVGFIVSVFLVAECKTYWQLLLGQGFAVGMFAGLLFGAAPSVVTHWFQKNRFSALGVVAVGSSVGGIVLPIATRQLITRVGYPWTIRILGFILLVTVSLGNLLIRRRLPPRNVKGGLFNFAEFKKPQFTLFVFACNAMFLGLYVPLTYFDIYAQSVGISPDISFYLISVANGGSLFGRLGGGILADKYGAMNVLIPSTTLAAIMTYSWPYATSLGPLIVVAFIYGVSSGVLIALIPSPPSRMGGMEDVGRRIGMVVTCTAVGAVTGPPIAGAVLTASGGFKDVGAYAGTMVLFGTCLMIASRRAHLGRWQGKF